MQQMFGHYSLKHSQFGLINKELFLFPLCYVYPIPMWRKKCVSKMSETASANVQEVRHDVPSLLLMSNSAHTFASVLSSNLHRQHGFKPSGKPSLSLSGSYQCPGWCCDYFLRRYLASYRPFRRCIDLLWRHLACLPSF